MHLSEHMYIQAYIFVCMCTVLILSVYSVLYIHLSVTPRDVFQEMLWGPPAVGLDARECLNAFSFKLSPEKMEYTVAPPLRD